MQAWARAGRDVRRPLLWMHAPSVGEGLMAKPVIERLRARRPELQLAYTWFSPSGEAFGQSLAADFADYLPFDTHRSARAWLGALRPSALVFSKLDVWPILTEAAVTQGVPVALTSASLSATSRRQSRVAHWLLADAYAALSAVGAASTEDAARLTTLGVPADRITVTGDTRYDQVWQRVQAPPNHPDLMARLLSPRPTLVAGSTWPADDAVLISAWPEIHRAIPDARLIVAPHEPDASHLRELHQRLSPLGLRSAGLSDAARDTDVVLVDRLGVLADLYALATVSYVGGGFHAAGLHSVVEPAAHGAPVLFGPRHGGSRDAAAIEASGGGFAVADAAALAARTISLMRDATLRAATSAKARAVVAAGLGAAERSAVLIERLLSGVPRGSTSFHH
ncbi:MAG: glycosyltransferase N-terminal domain-containing protein [Gemmatimonadota bacterium]|nr:glycosyltransferase N-terminal domain-containing protein [Gemmatimonadota bacterium]